MDILLRLIVCLVIGIVLGLEREVNKRNFKLANGQHTTILGLRDFVMVSLLGCLAGLLYEPALLAFVLITLGVLSLALFYYYFDSRSGETIGITTELSLFFAYFLSVMVAFNTFPIQIVLAILVVLVLFLSRKDEIKATTAKLKDYEIDAFSAYALIAVVILPFLPNTGYTINDIPRFANLLSNFNVNLGQFGEIELINPFSLWLVVAVITGIDVIGYILERLIGKGRGLLVASTVGGFISSTATTQSLAQQSKGSKQINYLLAAALFANMTSFVQILLLTAPINPLFFARIIPLVLVLTLVSGGAGYYFLRQKQTSTDTQSEEALKETEIINIKPALKFALLFLIIRFVSRVAFQLFGESGFLAASGLGAVAGLDAIIINTAQLTSQTINIKTGILALIIANAVNLVSKAFYCYTQGDKQFARKFAFSVALIIAASLVGLLF